MERYSGRQLAGDVTRNTDSSLKRGVPVMPVTITHIPQAFRGWERDMSGDRPELVYPEIQGEVPPINCEQLVGFKTKEGHDVEVTRQFALDVGLLVQGMCEYFEMPIGEYLHGTDKRIK